MIEFHLKDPGLTNSTLEIGFPSCATEKDIFIDSQGKQIRTENKESFQVEVKLGFHMIVKPGFHMIVTVGDLLRHIGDVSPISRRHMETITAMIIWKPGFKLISTLSMRPRTVPV